MKKIIFILLLISTTCFSQVYFSGTRQPLYADASADSLIARMTTAGVTVSDERAILIRKMFIMYKDSLNITYLNGFFDVLYFLDYGTATPACFNWAESGHNCDSYWGAVFDTAGAQFTTTSHLITNYILSTNAVNITTSDITMGVNLIEMDTVNRELVFMGGGAIGYSQGLIGMLSYENDSGALGINCYNIKHNYTWNDNKGMIIASRTSDENVNIYWEGLPDTSLIISAGSLYDQPVGINAGNLGGFTQRGNNKISHAFICKKLTDEQARMIYNIYKYWQNNKHLYP